MIHLAAGLARIASLLYAAESFGPGHSFFLR